MIALLFLTTVCPNGAVTMGVDVSQFQGTVDWSMVHGAGYDFAFIRATSGTTLADTQFANNWSGAGANGVIRGAYHFFHPSQDPVAQADFFVQTAGVPQAGDLPGVLDLEVTDGLNATDVRTAALAYLARVQQTTGRTPIIYLSTSFFNAIGSPSAFGSDTLWIANAGTTCPNIPDPPWSTWLFWQNSINGTVSGIGGTVDIDKFNGSLTDLQTFANMTPVLDGGADDGGTADANEVDAGIDAPTDAALLPEVADQPPVDAPRRDAPSIDANGGNQASSESGCSCSTSRAQSPPILLLLVLLSGWRLRRAVIRSRRR